MEGDKYGSKLQEAMEIIDWFGYEEKGFTASCRD